jgi:hypothetical protein
MNGEREDFVLANPSDAMKFARGMNLTVGAFRWYVRLRRWFKFRVLRRPRSGLTVTAVDYENGTIDVAPWEDRP